MNKLDWFIITASLGSSSGPTETGSVSVTIQTVDGKEDVVRSQQHSSSSQRSRMEAEDQDAAVRTGGQSDGYSWMFSSDGRFDAAENWRRIQNAHAIKETADEAEDPRTEPLAVARDMIEVQEDGGMAAVRAAQILEERFLVWDRVEQDRRRQEFMAQVQKEFQYTATEDDWYGVWFGGDREESQQPMGCVVYVSNLSDQVTDKILQGTFEQIGTVVGAGVEGEGCGWVEFGLAEDAEDAVQRYGGVVLAGQAMVCRMESGCETRADY